MSERKSYSILMVNLPFSGHTNPTLGLAQMLTDMGHRVTYVALQSWVWVEASRPPAMRSIRSL